VDQVVDRLRAGARADASMLAIRIDALVRFRRAAEGFLPAELLEPARIVAERAGQRLALSRTHTVVAVAGPTGSGKSSLFNALAGLQLSPVGVRRPTTGQVYACVWGAPVEAAATLDWLGVPPANRFALPDADTIDQAGLRHLILLDLPDFDSLELDHTSEVDRLLGLTDLVVWVVDPQKYADRTVHERHLRPLRRHRDVTVIALNQSDLLGAGDLARVMADLRRLLADDGLAGVPAVATSAVDVPAGVTRLRAVLVPVVAERRAALRRLGADLDAVVADLAGLVSPDRYDGTVDPRAEEELVDGLVEVAGVPAVAAAARAAYRRRAGAATGWPPLRWVWRRAEPAPLDPAHRPVATTGPGAVPAVPPRSSARRAAAGLAVRSVASRAATGLPPPWPEAVGQAARFHLDELPRALTAAVAAGPPGTGGVPWWWRLGSVAQRLLLGTSLAGLLWLVAGWLLRAVALPVTDPQAGPLPVPTLLALGGLAGGAVLAGAFRPVVRWAGRREGARAGELLRAAVAEVARGYVVAPVRAVLGAHAEARSALRTAAAPTPVR
jgi:energy-coupling factor transporter ATP-binding protein EcfA2